MRTCSYETESGTCSQSAFETAELERARLFADEPQMMLCHYHTARYLELLQSPASYLTGEEMDATESGRSHGDGRRLDQYVVESRKSTHRARY